MKKPPQSIKQERRKAGAAHRAASPRLSEDKNSIKKSLARPFAEAAEAALRELNPMTPTRGN